MSQSAVRNRPEARAGASTRYDEDLYTWVQEQVALLLRPFEADPKV